MYSEEEELLLPPGADHVIVERRRKTAPPPGSLERRLRRPPRPGRLKRMVVIAVLAHAAMGYALFGFWHPPLLGESREGGSGWQDYRMVVWDGPEDQPAGPEIPIPVVEPPPPAPVSVSASSQSAEALSPPPSAPVPVPAPGGGSAGPVRGTGESLGSVGDLPAAVWNPRPAYPPKAREAGQEGRVDVLLDLDPDGRVREVRLVTSSGYPLLDRSALASLRAWRFAPPGGSGAAFPYTVTFRLEDR